MTAVTRRAFLTAAGGTVVLPAIVNAAAQTSTPLLPLADAKLKIDQCHD